MSVKPVTRPMNVENLEYALDNSFDIATALIDTFGDGFQFSDAFAMPGIGKDFYDIGQSYQKVKEEVIDLDPIEVRYILKKYGDKAVDLWWKETNPDDDVYGIENIIEMQDLLHEVYVIVAEAIKSNDGFDLDDLDNIPEIKDIIQRLIQILPDVSREMQNLTGKEIASVGSELAMRVMLSFK